MHREHHVVDDRKVGARPAGEFLDPAADSYLQVTIILQ